MEAVINDYTGRELVRDSSLLPPGNTTSLLETGVLNSLSLLRPVVFNLCAYLRFQEVAIQAGSRG